MDRLDLLFVILLLASRVPVAGLGFIREARSSNFCIEVYQRLSIIPILSSI